jgi:Putative zinc-finger
MKECLNEEILQRYFDGELAGERMERAALHLAGCEACTASLNELEAETNILFSALAPEFDTAVPTERLQRRIQAAIAGLEVVGPIPSQAPVSAWRNWLESVSAMFSLSPQRAFAYGGFAAVLLIATILGIVGSRVKTPDTQTTSQSAKTILPDIPTPLPGNPRADAPIVVAKNPVQPKTLAAHKGPKVNRKPSPDSNSDPAVAVKLLPGERSYLKTIAALDTTIKSGNKTMRPALQAEYERNLALVDRAIATTRSAAKRNPNDPDAADFMFSAYQSKVDLLNTIADARVYNRQR